MIAVPLLGSMSAAELVGLVLNAPSFGVGYLLGCWHRARQRRKGV